MTLGSSRMGVQLQLPLGDAHRVIPWEHRCLRSLTRWHLCNVEKSDKMAEAARRDDFGPDPAQYTLYLKGRS